MSKNKVIKSVSFNITNEKDREYLQHIENLNFSGYVKGLIEKDIIGKKARAIHMNESGGIKIVLG